VADELNNGGRTGGEDPSDGAAPDPAIAAPGAAGAVPGPAAAPPGPHAARVPDGARLWILHGVNLDMLGRRDPAHYGALTLPELERAVSGEAEALGFAVSCYQTNHEGELIEKLHDLARGGTDAVLINPGAWTHYSYALHDALELVTAPIAEVHLSDVEAREEWRRRSVVADLAAVRVSGKGVDGYLEAVRRLAGLVAARGGREAGT
jgi:3-dehydroquinate dehydratase II